MHNARDTAGAAATAAASIVCMQIAAATISRPLATANYFIIVIAVQSTGISLIQHCSDHSVYLHFTNGCKYSI